MLEKLKEQRENCQAEWSVVSYGGGTLNLDLNNKKALEN